MDILSTAVESLKVVLAQTEIASQWLGNLAELIRNQLAAEAKFKHRAMCFHRILQEAK